MIKTTILILLLNSICSLADSDIKKSFTFTKERNKFHVMTSVLTQSTAIETQASDTSINSNADFALTGQKVMGEYFVFSNVSVIGGYYFGLIIDIDAEVQGFDVGVQYYPLDNGSSKNISLLGSEINTSPEWAPYVSVSASTRDYQFSSISLKFQGLDFTAGSYWHFGEQYFLKGDVFYQQQTNNNVRTLTTTGAGIGVGIKF